MEKPRPRKISGFAQGNPNNWLGQSPLFLHVCVCECVSVCVYVCACVCVYMFKTCWGASDDDNRGTELVLRLNLSAEISQTIKERF